MLATSMEVEEDAITVKRRWGEQNNETMANSFDTNEF